MLPSKGRLLAFHNSKIDRTIYNDVHSINMRNAYTDFWNNGMLCFGDFNATRFLLLKAWGDCRTPLAVTVLLLIVWPWIDHEMCSVSVHNKSTMGNNTIVFVVTQLCSIRTGCEPISGNNRRAWPHKGLATNLCVLKRTVLSCQENVRRKISLSKA